MQLEKISLKHSEISYGFFPRKIGLCIYSGQGCGNALNVKAQGSVKFVAIICVLSAQLGCQFTNCKQRKRKKVRNVKLAQCMQEFSIKIFTKSIKKENIKYKIKKPDLFSIKKILQSQKMVTVSNFRWCHMNIVKCQNQKMLFIQKTNRSNFSLTVMIFTSQQQRFFR